MNLFTYVLVCECFIFSFINNTAQKDKSPSLQNSSNSSDQVKEHFSKTSDENLKEIMIWKKSKILDEYSKVQVVSVLDIQIFCLILKVWGLDGYIIEFVTRILANTNSKIPAHEDIFRWLIFLFNGTMNVCKPFDDKLGQVLMSSFINNGFRLHTKLPYGSENLVNVGMVNSAINPNFLFSYKDSDAQDEFFFRDQNAQKVEVEIVSLKFRMD
jgi:hypothetical protein